MKLHDKLEDTLGGQWAGLYGEVVTEDCYHLQRLRFVPGVIFDIGANVGTFTRYAHELFPSAYIIAVEPDPENAAHFRKFTPPDAKIELYEIALGNGGPLFHGLTARNGSGETYLSAGLGYPLKKMQKDKSVVASSVKTLTLGEIIGFHWLEDQKTLIKIDCEGAENSIWEDSDSMNWLRRIDFIALEVHFYAQTHKEQVKVNKATLKALESLRATHDCDLEGVHFWATRKGL
jgi:FkbM family methyltransferase